MLGRADDPTWGWVGSSGVLVGGLSPVRRGRDGGEVRRPSGPTVLVGVDGDPIAAVIDEQFPAVLVDEPVVESAQQRTVVAACRAVLLTRLQMVGVAVPGRSGARGKHTVPVPGGKGSA